MPGPCIILGNVSGRGPVSEGFNASAALTVGILIFWGKFLPNSSPEEMFSEVELPTISLTSEEISPSLSSPEENPAHVQTDFLIIACEFGG